MHELCSSCPSVRRSCAVKVGSQNEPTRKGRMPPHLFIIFCVDQRNPLLTAHNVFSLLAGIVLSWNLVLNDSHAEISRYQVVDYHQNSRNAPTHLLWKKVGQVNALPLPMACTLTQVRTT